MNKQQLFENIKRKKSFLCVGLDTDIKKIPEHLLKEEDPIFAFNKAIIDATADLCIAYKPNLVKSRGLMALSKRLPQTNLMQTDSSPETMLPLGVEILPALVTRYPQK